VRTLARNSIDASFASAAVKTKLIQALSQW
jgi:adenosine deaminase